VHLREDRYMKNTVLALSAATVVVFASVSAAAGQSAGVPGRSGPDIQAEPLGP
jgi:hypothetical protein